MAWVVSNPPWTTLNTPFGSPIYFVSLARWSTAPATLSDGFKTNVFPQVMANGNIQSGIIAGKLKAATPAHTPNGVLKE